MLSHRPRSRVRVEHYPMGYQAMADDDPFRRVNLWQLMKAGCLVLFCVFACGGITAFLLLGGGGSAGTIPLTLTPTATPSEIGNISFDWTNTPSPTPTLTPSITPTILKGLTPTNITRPLATYTPYPTYTPVLPEVQIQELIITSPPEIIYQQGAIQYQDVLITSPPQIIEVTVVVIEHIQVVVTATPEPIIVITNPPPLTLLQPPTEEFTDEPVP